MSGYPKKPIELSSDCPECIESYVYDLDLRSLMCAMFERAWLDLSTDTYVDLQDRRTAISWFKGYNEKNVVFNFKLCKEVVPLTPERISLLRHRLKEAEEYRASLLREKWRKRKEKY